ncbi:hypothetical protein cyc_06861 [Cyclospora cayetanensis]|uniref:Uncharacterized protein n=1 Tax=Cyclospora cayetanensis TaxID=88456 RepID=A0A1D3D892_9EIME|nr:hypothetical protein cyc_06861 [Cyclospora cayetanensis]
MEQAHSSTHFGNDEVLRPCRSVGLVPRLLPVRLRFILLDNLTSTVDAYRCLYYLHCYHLFPFLMNGNTAEALTLCCMQPNSTNSLAIAIRLRDATSGKEPQPAVAATAVLRRSSSPVPPLRAAPLFASAPPPPASVTASASGAATAAALANATFARAEQAAPQAAATSAAHATPPARLLGSDFSVGSRTPSFLFCGAKGLLSRRPHERGPPFTLVAASRRKSSEAHQQAQQKQQDDRYRMLLLSEGTAQQREELWRELQQLRRQKLSTTGLVGMEMLAAEKRVLPHPHLRLMIAGSAFVVTREALGPLCLPTEKFIVPALGASPLASRGAAQETAGDVLEAATEAPFVGVPIADWETFPWPHYLEGLHLGEEMEALRHERDLVEKELPALAKRLKELDFDWQLGASTVSRIERELTEFRLLLKALPVYLASKPSPKAAFRGPPVYFVVPSGVSQEGTTTTTQGNEPQYPPETAAFRLGAACSALRQRGRFLYLPGALERLETEGVRTPRTAATVTGGSADSERDALISDFDFGAAEETSDCFYPFPMHSRRQTEGGYQYVFDLWSWDDVIEALQYFNDLYDPVAKALNRAVTFNELPADWKIPEPVAVVCLLYFLIPDLLFPTIHICIYLALQFFLSNWWGMPLGLYVHQIRQGDVDARFHPRRRPVLDRLGFRWEGTEKYLNFTWMKLLKGVKWWMFFRQHPIVQLGRDAVIPPSCLVADVCKPEEVQGLCIGEIVYQARLQEPVLYHHYPQRYELFRQFGLAILPAERLILSYPKVETDKEELAPRGFTLKELPEAIREEY